MSQPNLHTQLAYGIARKQLLLLSNAQAFTKPYTKLRFKIVALGAGEQRVRNRIKPQLSISTEYVNSVKS